VSDTPGGQAGGDTRDFVTTSYDPDRDTGYDPQAAGTAVSDARGYDPATDVGYVDEGRAGTDRATGRRDVDYDTGRVDTSRADPDLDAPGTSGAGASAADTAPRGGGTTGGAVAGGVAAGSVAAGAVAAGAAVAAGVDAVRHRDTGGRGTGYRETGYRDDDARFRAVDDTAPVDATPTGRAAPDTAAAGPATHGTGMAHAAGEGQVANRAEAVADEADEAGRSDHRERLVPADRARDYTARWDALKGDFVDEPRRAVAQADDLVGELLDEIQRLFTEQRRDLERGLDHDRATTEDLRLALRRYRSFFDRLLSF
jgi:hypothetical protein